MRSCIDDGAARINGMCQITRTYGMKESVRSPRAKMLLRLYRSVVYRKSHRFQRPKILLQLDNACYLGLLS
jgi:hypothetical protein